MATSSPCLIPIFSPTPNTPCALQILPLILLSLSAPWAQGRGDDTSNAHVLRPAAYDIITRPMEPQDLPRLIANILSLETRKAGRKSARMGSEGEHENVDFSKEDLFTVGAQEEHPFSPEELRQIHLDAYNEIRRQGEEQSNRASPGGAYRVWVMAMTPRRTRDGICQRRPCAFNLRHFPPEQPATTKRYRILAHALVEETDFSSAITLDVVWTIRWCFVAPEQARGDISESRVLQAFMEGLREHARKQSAMFSFRWGDVVKTNALTMFHREAKRCTGAKNVNDDCLLGEHNDRSKETELFFKLQNARGHGFPVRLGEVTNFGVPKLAIRWITPVESYWRILKLPLVLSNALEALLQKLEGQGMGKGFNIHIVGANADDEEAVLRGGMDVLGTLLLPTVDTCEILLIGRDIDPNLHGHRISNHLFKGCGLFYPFIRTSFYRGTVDSLFQNHRGISVDVPQYLQVYVLHQHAVSAMPERWLPGLIDIFSSGFPALFTSTNLESLRKDVKWFRSSGLDIITEILTTKDNGLPSSITQHLDHDYPRDSTNINIHNFFYVWVKGKAGVKRENLIDQLTSALFL